VSAVAWPGAPRPDAPSLPRVTRAELLARRAEALTPNSDPAEMLAVLAEMGRELFRLAHALDGVV
jgi:hypothetical protein